MVLCAWTFLCSQRIPVHLLVSIRKNEITMRVLGFSLLCRNATNTFPQINSSKATFTIAFQHETAEHTKHFGRLVWFHTVLFKRCDKRSFQNRRLNDGNVLTEGKICLFCYSICRYKLLTLEQVLYK